MISEHASALVLVGGLDVGRHNVYVVTAARWLAAASPLVHMLTRRKDAGRAAALSMCGGMRMLHLLAGLARCVPNEAALPE